MSKYKTLEVLELEGVSYPVGSILELTDEQAVDLLDKMEEVVGQDIITEAANIAAPIIPETPELINFVVSASTEVKSEEVKSEEIKTETDPDPVPPVVTPEVKTEAADNGETVVAEAKPWAGHHDVMAEEKKNETI